jgi:hypothetical protein
MVFGAVCQQNLQTVVHSVGLMAAGVEAADLS